MAVIVTEKCRVAWDCGVTDLETGQEIPSGELANYLLSTGAPVEAVSEPEVSDQDTAGSVPRPAVNAAKADWVAHVADLHGLDHDEVGQLTKPALIEMADSPPEDPNAAPAGESN